MRPLRSKPWLTHELAMEGLLQFEARRSCKMHFLRQLSARVVGAGSLVDWKGDVENQVTFELNTDFSTQGLIPLEIQSILAAWQAGAISRDTMTELFRRGEVFPEGHTDVEEKRLIESSKGEVVAGPVAGVAQGRRI